MDKPSIKKIDDAEIAWSTWITGTLAGATSSGTVPAEELTRLQSDSARLAQGLNGALKDGLKIKGDTGKQLYESNKSSAASARTLIISLILGGALIAAGIGFFLAQTMTTSLKTVVARLTSLREHCIAGLNTGMSALAGGDLTFDVQPVTPKIDKYSSDEVGQAAAAVNDIIGTMVTTIANYNSTRASLTELISGISKNVEKLTEAKDELGQSADQAAQATQQIAQTATQVAEGTNQTAKSVQDVSTSMGELDQAIAQVADGTIKTSRSAQEVSNSVTKLAESAMQLEETARTQIARAADDMVANAQAATEGARVASDTAQNGAKMVQRTIDGMQRIKQIGATAGQEISQLGTRSQEIGNIVAVIEDIAAQTNLLALNAPSKRPVRASRGAASPWSLTRCASWPSESPAPRRRSPA